MGLKPWQGYFPIAFALLSSRFSVANNVGTIDLGDLLQVWCQNRDGLRVQYREL